MLRGVELVTALSGPLVLVAIAVGVVAQHQATRRLRSPDARALAVTAVGLAASLVVWTVVDALAPGSSEFTQSSGVGFLSSQVLRVWESLALWSGAAVVVGTMVAVERTPRVRLRLAGSGLGPAAGLALLYLPLIGLPALVAWAVIRPLSPDRAWATAATITSAVGAAWVFSVIDPASPWGLVHGPETALWAAVVGGALLGRLAADQ